MSIRKHRGRPLVQSTPGKGSSDILSAEFRQEDRSR
jgi:hypothetical protein